MSARGPACMPTRGQRKYMSTPELLRHLTLRKEDFLKKWVRTMGEAGYLDHTTAKREDCLDAFNWFLDPVLEHLDQCGGAPAFGELIAGQANWAEALLASSERHRFRGVNSNMFVGCFFTMIHSIEEMIDETEAPLAAKVEAADIVRLYADAFTTLLLARWGELSSEEVAGRLDESARLLTLEKNKYENILAVISDMVLIVDENGKLLELNQAASEFFDAATMGLPVWSLLDLEARSMEDMLKYYPQDTAQELAAPDGSSFFEMRIIPLERVSLASPAYLVVLKDITVHVTHRDILEDTVRERTEALEQDKQQLAEMNITLRNVMRSVDNELDDHKQTVGRMAEELLPALDKLRRADSPMVRKAYLDVLEDQLLKLSAGARPDQHPALLRLTPTEMKVCQFIEAGASTKDIAEALNLAVGTVQSHRKNIRRKLKLQNKDVNLRTFLSKTHSSNSHA